MCPLAEEQQIFLDIRNMFSQMMSEHQRDGSCWHNLVETVRRPRSGAVFGASKKKGSAKDIADFWSAK